MYTLVQPGNASQTKLFVGRKGLNLRRIAMGLLERVSTSIRANLNHMIDRAGDPEKLTKQVILDMDN